MEPIGQHHLSWIPSGKLTWLLNMVAYSCCTHKTRWYCMAMIMLSFQRVNHGKSLQPPSSPLCDSHLSPGSCQLHNSVRLPVASSQAKHGDVMVSQTKGRLCPQGAFMEQTVNHSCWSARAIAVTANSFLIHIYHNDPISRLVGLGGWTDGLMDWWTNRGEQRSSQSAALMQLIRTGPSVRCSPFSCFDWRMHYESMCVMYSVNADAHAHTRM